jgi:hypothetical protein
MQFDKEFLKNKTRKYVKQTMAGPCQWAVFIIICIIIIATFETLGLSNREKNLELRTVQTIDTHLLSEITNEKLVENIGIRADTIINDKIKKATRLDIVKKNMERENILLIGAVNQYLYEKRGSNSEFQNLSIERLVYQFRKEEEEEDSFLLDI